MAFYVATLLLINDIFQNYSYKKSFQKNRMINSACPAKSDYFWNSEKSLFDKHNIVRKSFIRFVLITTAVSLFFLPFITTLMSGAPKDVLYYLFITLLWGFVIYELIRFIILAVSYIPSPRTALFWKSFPILRGVPSELIFEVKKSDTDDIVVSGRILLKEELDNQKQEEAYVVGAVRRVIIWNSKIEFIQTAAGRFSAKIEVPRELPATNISGTGKIFFWELEVFATYKKPKWRELHLLPVY